MAQFFNLIAQFFREVWEKLSAVTFSAYGFSVPFTSILVVFIIIGMVINVFWKGAKT